MADRYDERYRTPRDHDRDRGPIDRGTDEVRSWFGDDEAQRRRQQDEMRDRSRGTPPERGWGEERMGPAGRYSIDDGRIEYDRSGAAYRGWNEPRYGYRPAAGYGPGEWSTTNWRSHGDRAPGETRGYYEDPQGRVHMSEHGREGGHADYRGNAGYVGRGPKGYRRSDQRITEDICDRLADDPYIDASEIEVAVKDAEVTLSGRVRSRHEKRGAEDLIESVSGVTDVHNHLRVEHWQPSASPLGLTQTAQPTATPPTTRR
jgi:hypothetical protein